MAITVRQPEPITEEPLVVEEKTVTAESVEELITDPEFSSWNVDNRAICTHVATEMAILDMLKKVKGQEYDHISDPAILVDKHIVLMFVPVPELKAYVRVMGVIGNVSNHTNIDPETGEETPVMGIYYGGEEFQPIVVSVIEGGNVYIDEVLLDEIAEAGDVQDIIKDETYMRLDSHDLIDFDNSIRLVEVKNPDDYEEEIKELKLVDDSDTLEYYPVIHMSNTVELSFDKDFIKERLPEKYEDYEIICNPVTFQVNVYQTLEVPAPLLDFYESVIENNESINMPYIIDNNFATKALEIPKEEKVYAWSLTPDRMQFEESTINSLTAYHELILKHQDYFNAINEMEQLRQMYDNFIKTTELLHPSLAQLEDGQLSPFSNLDSDLEEAKAFVDQYIELRAKLVHLMKLTETRLQDVYGDQLHSSKFIQDQLVSRLVEVHESAVNTAGEDSKVAKKLARRLDGATNRFSTEYLENKIISNEKKLKKEINKMLKKAKHPVDKYDVLYNASLSYTDIFPTDGVGIAQDFLKCIEVDHNKDALASMLLLWYLTSKTASAKESGNDAYYKMHLYNLTEMCLDTFDIDVDREAYRASIIKVKWMLYNLIEGV